MRGGIPVIELKRVGPTGEIGIATVRQHQVAAFALRAGVVLRGAGQVLLRPLDEVIRMFFDPEVIECDVIGDKVEHETNAALLQPGTQASQCRISAQIAVHGIPGDREAGTANVLFAQIGKRLLEFLTPLRMRPGDFVRGRAGLPDTEEPDPVETRFGEVVEFGLRNVVER